LEDSAVGNIILKRIVGLNSTDQAENRVVGCCEDGDEPSRPVKGRNFFTWSCCWWNHRWHAARQMTNLRFAYSDTRRSKDLTLNMWSHEDHMRTDSTRKWALFTCRMLL